MSDAAVTLSALSVLAFATSAVTAAVGMGGGLMLLALLPSFLPAAAIVPVHGAVQLSSNLSRWLFGRTDTAVRPLWLFTAGAVLGALAGSAGLERLHLEHVPMLLSVFILLVLWTSVLDLLLKLPGKYLSLGAVQTAVALYVGATGPVSTTVLHKDGLSANRVIVTNAAINTVLNVAKIAVYVQLGFVFAGHAAAIAAMSLCAVAGSFAGTRLRGRFDPERARSVLKWLITAVCLANLWNAAGPLRAALVGAAP